MKNINEVVKTPEYGFLKTNPLLGENIMFLTFGGSHAYGTNNENSDIDVRGCAFNRKSDLLGMTNFEQVIDNTTDTTIYSFRKLIGLLLNCNPNCIELLGCKPEHYILQHPIAQEFIDNRKMFLSRRAAGSFGGYALAQLQRLQNAVARDALNEAEKESHMLNAVKRAMLSFNERYVEFDEGAIQLYIDKSEKEDIDTEIFMNVAMQHYPLRDYKSMWSEMHEIVKVYGKLNHRNNKKSEEKLDKHAMHLVRLYLMALDIFEKEEIITYRADDREFLLSIRNGEFARDDGTYKPEFFELVADYEKRLNYAVVNTSLPAKPDYKRVEEFVMSVNARLLAERE